MNRTSAKVFGFYAPDAKLDPEFVEREDIDVMPVSFEVFRDMVADGRFQQLPALALFCLKEWFH